MKNTKKRLMFKSALSVILLAVLGGCSSAKPKTIAQPTSIENLEVKPLQGPMTADHAQRLTEYTKSALRDVAKAREALKSENYEEASDNLKKASYFMDAVKKQMPAAIVIDTIENLKNNIDEISIAEVHANLIPIYGQLTEIDTYMPHRTKNVRDHLKRSEKNFKKNNKKNAKQSLDLAITDLNYGEVNVKVDKLVNLINTAQGLVTNGNYEEAKLAIDNSHPFLVVEDNVFFEPLSHWNQ